MTKRIACCLTLLAVLGTGAAPTAWADEPVASAARADSVLRKGDRGRAVRKLQRALGITADGVFGRQTARAVRRFQRAKGLEVDGIVGPLTRRALGLPEVLSARADPGPGSVAAILERIAECESGGDPTAVSAGGRYRGKYQFSLETWKGLGGKGDPARAPERVQDRMARKLYRMSGTAPWPTCGRGLG